MLRALIAVCCLSALNAGAEASPFWRSKQKIYQRVLEGEVIVSSRSAEPVPPLKKRIEFDGGGLVRKECADVFAYAQDYERVARESGWVREVSFDSATKLLSVEISALGRTGRAKIEVSSVQEPRRVVFKIREGSFTGLLAQIDFVELGSSRCEVGISGDYGYDRFVLPQFFLNFGLEVMLRKMATRLRDEVQRSQESVNAK
jgi:hypothetical protein